MMPSRLLAAASLAFATAALAADVPLHWLDQAPPPAGTGVSFGVPWPRGTVPKDQAFALTTADGKSLPVQTWPLAYWPDGTLKWTGVATVGGPKSATGLTLSTVATATKIDGALTVRRTDNSIEINTGPLTCRLATSGHALIDSLAIDGKEVARAGQLVCVLQNGPDGDADSTPRREKFLGTIEQVTVEQSGPVRAVVKIDGHHYGLQGERHWLPFSVRLYFYKGETAVRMVHTIVYDGNEATDFIRGLGVTFAVPMREPVQNRHVRFSGGSAEGGLWGEPIQPGSGNATQVAGEPFQGGRYWGPDGDFAIWSDFKLTQSSPEGFTVAKRTNPQSTWLFSDAGKRASGLAFVGDTTGGLAISVKNFWQSFPAGLEIRDAAKSTAQLTAWLWSPDGPAMDMRHYDIKAHGLPASYEDVQEGMSTPYGVGRTSELTLFPTKAVPARNDTVALAHLGEKLPLLAATPQYLRSTGVFGNWSVADRSTPLKAAVEDKLDSTLAYYQQQIDERHWYGFWTYGDVIHSYNNAAHVWYYDFGGHAWDNTELGAPLWAWTSYLRTGRADYFRFAEALSRNTSETCVYHLGPMAGLGSRHNVIKWGCGAKEARISQAAHWRPFYYLTSDERTGDIMREMLQSDLAAIAHDPMRLAQPPLPQDPQVPGRIRIGPDWFALVGNWMTEWERTGDTKWRDRILAGVDSILAMPYWIRSGVFNGLNPDRRDGGIGPLKGGGSMTVGYDPATGKLIAIPDPIAKEQVPVTYNLTTIQGGAEVMFELLPLLARDDWAKAWLQFCRLGGTVPQEQGGAKELAAILKRDQTTGHERDDGSLVETAQGGPRLAAYAYSVTKNPAFAKIALNTLSRARPATQRPITGSDALNPVHEAFVSTNDAAQTSLTLVEILDLCADALPNELPAPPEGGFGGRRRGANNNAAPAQTPPVTPP